MKLPANVPVDAVKANFKFVAPDDKAEGPSTVILFSALRLP